MRTARRSPSLLRDWRSALAAALTVTLGASAALAAGSAPPRRDFGYTYAPPLEGEVTGKRNAVVIVHGWTSSPSDWPRTSTWPTGLDGMQPLIRTALGEAAANWDVWALDWSADASDPDGGFAPNNTAMMRAQMQGHYIASRLLAEGTYDHVHLIGHSLGGRVIESAATLLSQDEDAPRIHTTFLDAYTPSQWSRVYGSTSTWSEHYYNRWVNGGILDPDDAPLTESPFPHAMNVDATAIHDAMPTGEDGYPYGLTSWNHNWPQRFYRRSVAGANDATPPFAGYGFGLSAEKRETWPPGAAYRTATKRAFNADGTMGATQSIDRAIVRHPASFSLSDPGVAVKGAFHSVTDDMLCLSAASGLDSWARLNFTTTQDLNFFEFEFMFQGTDPRDLLSFYIDAEDALHFQANAEHRLGGWEDTGKITLLSSLRLRPGAHTIAFRFDTTSDVGDVWIRNIKGGLLDVPAPGAAACLAFGLFAITPRRRARAV